MLLIEQLWLLLAVLAQLLQHHYPPLGVAGAVLGGYKTLFLSCKFGE